jgi:hypothetical protein
VSLRAGKRKARDSPEQQTLNLTSEIESRKRLMDFSYLCSSLLLLLLVVLSVSASAVNEETIDESNTARLSKRLNENDSENCSTRHSVPSYFWDWLLFPVAIDDLVGKLEDLSVKLGAINTQLSALDYDQIPTDSLNFAQILQANYEWLAAEDAASGGALVPFNRLLDVMETKFEGAIN